MVSVCNLYMVLLYGGERQHTRPTCKEAAYIPELFYGAMERNAGVPEEQTTVGVGAPVYVSGCDLESQLTGLRAKTGTGTQGDEQKYEKGPSHPGRDPRSGLLVTPFNPTCCPSCVTEVPTNE